MKVKIEVTLEEAIKDKDYPKTISSFTTEIEGNHNIYRDFVVAVVKLIQARFKSKT